MAVTAASNPANAVLVAPASTLVFVGIPPSRVGVGLGNDSLVGEAFPSGLAVVFGVGVTLLVGLDSLVTLADGMPVFVCVGVVEGPPVGPGPIEGVSLGARVRVEVGDMEGVEVGLDVNVGVLVGVGVCVADGGGFVGVAVGLSTIRADGLVSSRHISNVNVP